MRAMLMGVAVVTLTLLCTSAAMAQQPGSLPTVVARNTIPGNGDLDEDGDVDTVDGLYVLQIVYMGKTGAGYPPSVRGFHQGDANHNGRLDKEDVTLIQQHVVGMIRLPKYQFRRGDADGSGSVTAVDALVVTQYLENLALAAPLKLYNADANQDYFVDKRDVDCIMSTIMRMVVGGQRCY